MGRPPYATPCHSREEEARFRVMLTLQDHPEWNNKVLDLRGQGLRWQAILNELPDKCPIPVRLRFAKKLL